ncbi:MAG TPA: hypothetical protein VNQ74_15670, partial [Burkholderiaceae bacterium]|nr:hypothetical protein [Burkholderiaceae bacterium]
FDPLRAGFAIALALRRTHADKWEYANYMRLLGNEQVFEAVKSNQTLDEIEQGYAQDLQHFKSRREAYLLYPER